MSERRGRCTDGVQCAESVGRLAYDASEGSGLGERTDAHIPDGAGVDMGEDLLY